MAKYTSGPDTAVTRAGDDVIFDLEFEPSNGFYVAASGDVEVTPSSQSTSIIFVNAVGGTVLPLSIKKVISGSVVPLGTLANLIDILQPLVLNGDGDQVTNTDGTPVRVAV